MTNGSEAPVVEEPQIWPYCSVISKVRFKWQIIAETFLGICSDRKIEWPILGAKSKQLKTFVGNLSAI